MAPTVLNCFLFPNHTHSPQVLCPRFRCSLSVSPASAKGKWGKRGGGGNGEKKSGTAILWYKHDLRVDDHVGLVAASKYGTVLPLYVFDRRILSRFSDEKVELILIALEDLRVSLKELGSNLMLRFGDAEYIIQELVKEVKASIIFTEEEVEHNILAIIDAVKRTLADDPSLDWNLNVTSWRTPFYHVELLPKSYTDLKKLQFSEISPLDPPRLQSFPKEFDWGNFPTIDCVRKFMYHDLPIGRQSWESMKEFSAEIALSKELVKLIRSSGEALRQPKSTKSGERQSKLPQELKHGKSVFNTSNEYVVAGGTDMVLNALAAYLRYLEGTARDDWQEVHQKLQETETRGGASFGTLFGHSLEMGILSRRRAYYEAITYEKERNAGFLSPFGYSTTNVASVIDTVCSMEWFWLLARKSQLSKDGLCPTKIWRWNGYLIQYTVAGHEGPSTLLVHGFGAFLEHYRDNMNCIADGENRVWALTLLGFGRSDKPNIVYTELLWAELLRDFIIEVVGEPVHLVGNSIGGYLVAIVCGAWPSLVKSVVLINSAGEAVSGYSSLGWSKQRETSGIAWLGARLVLPYLRFNLGSLVKKCYPSRTDRVDDWLLSEMLRASYDPGVISVLESVFSFNLSIPLNLLLAKMEGRVLIIQGMKDPVADSASRLAMLREHCSGIEIKEIEDAGHCPHDECPEEVNSIICEWIMKVKGRELSLC